MNALATHRMLVFQPLINVRKMMQEDLKRKFFHGSQERDVIRHHRAYQTKMWQLRISMQQQLSSAWATSLAGFLNFCGVIHHAQENILIRRSFWKITSSNYHSEFKTHQYHPQIQAEKTSFSYLSNSKVKRQVCRKHGIVSFSETLPEPFESHHLPENWQVWKCDRGFTKI